MEIKILEPSEYSLLKDTPDGQLFTPENSVVPAAIEDGKIVIRLPLMNLIHLEGSWSDRRRGETFKKVEELLYEHAKKLGLSHIHTYAPTLAHEDILQRAGWERLPVSVWTKEL